MYKLASSTWDDKEIKAIKQVIDSGVFTMGRNVAEFEEAFSDKIGKKYSVMVNSGSSANLLMIASLFFTSNNEHKINKGDEIIVPAVSWSTTYLPLQQYGLKLVFVDIDKETLNYDLNELERAITEKTRGILVVNLLGNPNDFSKIDQLIKGRRILKLLDNCESMGSKFNGNDTSQYSLLSTHSCFFSHHISTMEGGLVSTDDEELYHILLSLRAHGWTRNLPNENKVTGLKSSNPFEESFKFVLPGYNLRPLELSGAIGLQQLLKLDSLIENRRENAEYFQTKFKNVSEISIQKEIGLSSWFGFSIILKTKNREEVLKVLNNNLIETRPIVAGNFVKNPVIKYFNYKISGTLHNANTLDDKGFFVGNHHYIIKDEINLLYQLLDKVLK
jgi:CDP-4-dehydro-6-deoxyglucose reductase, E1